MPNALNIPRPEQFAPIAGNNDLLDLLKKIVGAAHVLSSDSATRRYRKGFRHGGGRVLAVVRPGTLVEQWRVLKACVAADTIIIAQAANTGLTGGSTPDGDDYDRGIVIINTLRLNGIQLLDRGRQVVALPGATLHRLEKLLAPLGREPHSVIGSSCIGASVVGGVCNTSGGALVRRGPAFTELALFACCDDDGEVRLVNHLGIDLGETPEDILTRLDRRDYAPGDVAPASDRAASDHDYAQHVRGIDEDTPARFNADPRRLFEASGCAGKLMVFAVRLDTFERAETTRTFYIGTHKPERFTLLRRNILSRFRSLPVYVEYLHGDAYDMAARYGKDSFLMIYHLGTQAIPAFFALKARFDGLMERVPFAPRSFSDRILQTLGRLFPGHLPKRMSNFRRLYDHHLILTAADDGIAEARAYLQDHFPDGEWFECTPDEARRAALHRFAAASAAVRYRAIHAEEVEDIVALDIALRRNDTQWIETLPPRLDAKISHKLYYGHFLCHVFHQDYIVRKGGDCAAIEHDMLQGLDARRARYPAEHNVGHLYEAPKPLKAFYQKLDPTNRFNPGIGRTSKCRHWRCTGGHESEI